MVKEDCAYTEDVCEAQIVFVRVLHNKPSTDWSDLWWVYIHEVLTSHRI